MKMTEKMFRSSVLCSAALCLVAAVGCDAPIAQFSINRLYIAKQTEGQGLPKKQMEDVSVALAAMFGSPDQPFPRDEAEAAALGVTGVIDPAYLPMAAGAVGRDENGFPRGLYRQHCVHCHGITGDGHGPTAEFLNPFPRDFRPGRFKFKSTPIGAMPTDEDLTKTLIDGIPGTAMPSFKVLLADDEIKAMVNYVKYLAVRGEMERKLVDEAVFEVGVEGNMDLSRGVLVESLLADIVAKWAAADGAVTPVPPMPSMNSAELAASVKRGNELFHGKLANCFSCHGVTAIGDGQTTDFDFWTLDFADWNKITDAKEKEAKLAQYHALGGLGPRNILPRNLRQNTFRGGRRPIDIYWRVRNGIEGTPMPAATLTQGAGPGLTEDDVWHIVNYVQSLPYESLSLPPEQVLENLRANP
jgi:mono/diheme cytochrome c family protein